jgi:hypothetical protein
MAGCEPIVDEAESVNQPPAVGTGSVFHEVDCQLAVISEPLRTAATGQEAVRDMLQGVLAASLPVPTVLHFGVEIDSTRAVGKEWRHQLRRQLIKRLQHSVSEGELPEDADVQVLSCLCVSFASGLAVSLQDGISKTWLEGSIPLFLESVGFHKIRIPKRRPRGSSPLRRGVLTLVKR